MTAPAIDPAEYPNCVRLLASARHRSALQLPDPVGRLTADSAAAIDVSSELIQLTAGLGWDAAVQAEMAGFSVPEPVKVVRF